MKKFFMILVFSTFIAGLASGDTIYVDASNTTAPWDGLTPTTAWQTIEEGLDHLATVNVGPQGGHTVIVAAGVYVEDNTVTNLHAGLDGTPNTLLSTNLATIQGRFTFVLGSSDFIIDGFNITAPDAAAINLIGNSGAHRNIIRNCNIYNSAAAINLNRGNNDVTVDHCNIVHNNGYAVYHQVTYRTTVKNCNIVNNAGGGVISGDYRFAFFLTNNLFAANGFNIAVNGIYNTPEEFPEMSVGPTIVPGFVTNCIVANPGFAALNNNWDFSVVYENSPIINAAVDNKHSGAIQNLTFVPVSSNTYYVDGSIGDDANTGLGEDAANAWASITNAAAIAIAGDSVIVKAGVYTDPVIFENSGVEGKPVLFRAEDDVVIGDQTADTAVHFRRVTGINFEGFKSTALGTAIRLESSALVNMLNIEAYSSATGIVFHAASSNSLVASKVFSNATHALYFHEGGANMVKKSDLHNNLSNAIQMPSGGSGQNRFHNCNIYDNAGSGFYCYTYTERTSFLNCNIYNNSGHGLLPRGSRMSAVNCIIANNGGFGVYEFYTACRVFLENNCFFDNTLGNLQDRDGGTCNSAAEINAQADCENNIVGDPLLVNPSSDMRLKPGTPCESAGTTNTLTHSSLIIPPTKEDYFGKKRPVGAGPEIGVYEFPPMGLILFSL